MSYILHPWPTITAKTKHWIFCTLQEKRHERTATPASPEGQNIWIERYDPNGYLILRISVPFTALKTHCKCIPDLHTYFAGYFWDYYLGFVFFLCVDSYIKHMKNTPAYPQSACETTKLQKSLPERSWSIKATLYTLSSFAKLPGSVIIIIKVNYILCHVISQLTKHP